MMINKLKSFRQYPGYFRVLVGRYIYANILRLSGVYLANHVTLLGFPLVSLHKGSEIVIDSNCTLCSLSRMTDLGVQHAVILRTLRPNASIRIGSHTGISGGSICAATRIEIGKECLIGANVTITDSDFHPIKPQGRRYNVDPNDIGSEAVIVEDNVFIGTGSIILKGVRIGKNSVIGAGSIVTKDIPENSIAAGNPAKVIKIIG